MRLKLTKFQKRKKNQRKKTRYKPIGEKREAFNLGYNIRDCIKQISILQEQLALAKRSGNVQEMNSKIQEIISSQEAKVLAVHRVVVNKGYRSPGLSKESFRSNEDYRRMIDNLGKIVDNPSIYKATPLDRIYLPKPNGGQRPISIPSYLDRCLQGLYKLVLEPITEETADDSSFGFRPIRSIHWASGRVLNLLSNPLVNYNYGISLDIAKYFDSIAQKAIVDKTQGIIPDFIVQEWLNCGYIERGDPQVFETPVGVPQGGILSPTLSNTVLDGLESHLKIIGSAPSSSTAKDRGVAMVRYADDIFLFTRSYAMALLVIDAVKAYIEPIGLQLNLQKTRILDLNLESFVYVGFQFQRVLRRNNKRYTAYIKVPQQAIQSFRQKIDAKRRECSTLTKFISEINPIIIGWANNYRFAHNFRYVSRSLQYWLWKKVYAKAYKIYSKSNPKALHDEIHEAILNKYFSSYETYSSWPVVYNRRGKPTTLFRIIKVESKNPTYTNKAKNAYISSDRIILEKVALKLIPGIRSKILETWGFRCACCGEHIATSGVKYELHHKRPRMFGGSNRPSNLIPLCREPCHLDLTKAMAVKNPILIYKYIDMGILDLPEEVLSKWSIPVNK